LISSVGSFFSNETGVDGMASIALGLLLATLETFDRSIGRMRG
jgi:hypothetical protein